MDSQTLSERFKSERSLLERIMARIPGFKGYISYTERCDTDRIVRSFEGEKVLRVKGKIRGIMEDATRAGNLSVLTALENADIRIEKLYREIVSAEPPVVSTFSHSRPRISEEEFAKAIMLDDMILSILDEMVEMAENAGPDGEKLLSGIPQRISSVENVMSERKRILWGV